MPDWSLYLIGAIAVLIALALAVRHGVESRRCFRDTDDEWKPL